MRNFLSCLLLLVVTAANAQKKTTTTKTSTTANPKQATSIINVGSVLVYKFGENGILTMKVTHLSPLAFDYVITGSDEYRFGSLSHSADILKSGDNIKSPANYKDAQYSDNEFLSVWLSKNTYAALNSGKPVSLTFNNGDAVTFKKTGDFEFNFNLHEKLYNRDTAYTHAKPYVHGIKRELKAINCTDASGKATLEVWKNPSHPLILYFSTADGYEMRLEAIL